MHSAKRRNEFYSSSDSKLEIKANIEGKIQTIEIPQYAIRFESQFFLLNEKLEI